MISAIFLSRSMRWRADRTVQDCGSGGGSGPTAAIEATVSSGSGLSYDDTANDTYIYV